MFKQVFTFSFWNPQSLTERTNNFQFEEVTKVEL